MTDQNCLLCIFGPGCTTSEFNNFSSDPDLKFKRMRTRGLENDKPFRHLNPYETNTCGGSQYFRLRNRFVYCWKYDTGSYRRVGTIMDEVTWNKTGLRHTRRSTWLTRLHSIFKSFCLSPKQDYRCFSSFVYARYVVHHLYDYSFHSFGIPTSDGTTYRIRLFRRTTLLSRL